MAAKIAKIRKSQDSDNGKSDKANPYQYKFIFLGSHHKSSLFEKLIDAADRYEKHLQYEDVWYLHLNVDGNDCAIELNDPGLLHTGSREMAIRKADAIILSYSSMNVSSFHQLSSIAEDFKRRKDFKYPPVRIICNEDTVIEDDIETTSIADQSSSEGYESEDNSLKTSTGMIKRKSMEKIIDAANENIKITKEQGEKMTNLFGPDAEFHSLSIKNFTESRSMLENLIRIVNEKNPKKIKSINKDRKRFNKQRSSSVHSAKISPTNSIKSEPASLSSDIENVKTKRRSSLNISRRISIKKGNSTVCTIS